MSGTIGITCTVQSAVKKKELYFKAIDVLETTYSSVKLSYLTNLDKPANSVNVRNIEKMEPRVPEKYFGEVGDLSYTASYTGMIPSIYLESNTVKIKNLDDGCSLSISGTSTKNNIVIESSCNGTISMNINLTASLNESAFIIKSGAKVKLNITGSIDVNSSSSDTPTLLVEEGAFVEICPGSSSFIVRGESNSARIIFDSYSRIKEEKAAPPGFEGNNGCKNIKNLGTIIVPDLYEIKEYYDFPEAPRKLIVNNGTFVFKNNQVYSEYITGNPIVSYIKETTLILSGQEGVDWIQEENRYLIKNTCNEITISGSSNKNIEAEEGENDLTINLNGINAPTTQIRTNRTTTVFIKENTTNSLEYLLMDKSHGSKILTISADNCINSILNIFQISVSTGNIYIKNGIINAGYAIGAEGYDYIDNLILYNGVVNTDHFGGGEDASIKNISIHDGILFSNRLGDDGFGGSLDSAEFLGGIIMCPSINTSNISISNQAVVITKYKTAFDKINSKKKGLLIKADQFKSIDDLKIFSINNKTGEIIINNDLTIESDYMGSSDLSCPNGQIIINEGTKVIANNLYLQDQQGQTKAPNVDSAGSKLINNGELTILPGKTLYAKALYNATHENNGTIYNLGEIIGKESLVGKGRIVELELTAEVNGELYNDITVDKVNKTVTIDNLAPETDYDINLIASFEPYIERSKTIKHRTLEAPPVLMDGKSFNNEIKKITNLSSITEVHFLKTDNTLNGTNVASQGNVKARIEGGILYIESNGEILANKICSHMFSYFDSLVNIDFSNFNTKNVTDMSYMFYGCYKINLKNALLGFNTSNVTDMSSMFGSSSIYEADTSYFDTSNVTDMYYMFGHCRSLSGEILIMNPNVSDYGSMFTNCSTNSSEFIVNYKPNCKNIAEQMISTKSSNSNVILGDSINTLVDGNAFKDTISKMSGFENITEIHFVKTTNSLTGTNVALEGNIKARINNTILYIESDGKIFANKNCSNMFNEFGCHTSNNKKINKFVFENFDTRFVENMDNMFSSCENITELDLSKFKTLRLKTSINMFNNCKSLTAINLKNWNIDNAINIKGMFKNCTNLKTLSTIKLNKTKEIAELFKGCTSLNTSIIIETIDIINYKDILLGCSTTDSSKLVVKYKDDKTKEIAKNIVNTKDENAYVYLDGDQPPILMQGNDFNNTLEQMANISNVSEIHFKRVKTDPSGTNVASEGKAVARIDGNILYIESTQTMYANNNCLNMFSSLGYEYGKNKILSKIVFENLNTHNTTNMSSMFYECEQLKEIIGFDTLDTSNVVKMSSMFYGCKKLEYIHNIDKINTKNVTDMNNMFEKCLKLKSLNLEKINIENLINTKSMFAYCNSVVGSITITHTNITNYSSMFYDCSSNSSAKFIVNYTNDDTKILAQNMINTKGEFSWGGDPNVVLGSQVSRPKHS